MDELLQLDRSRKNMPCLQSFYSGGFEEVNTSFYFPYILNTSTKNKEFFPKPQ